MGYDGWENYDPAAPKKDPTRQLQGKLNKVNGDRLEAYIKAACEIYKREGLAVVDKTPEPFHITGKKRKQSGAFAFEGFFESPA